MSFVVFKLKERPGNFVSEIKAYDYKFWKPSFKSFSPPALPGKYILWWFFHYFRIFKNDAYGAVLVYDKEVLIHSYCIVPAYFRWPFMKVNDVQLTYVVTNPAYRGKGIAASAIAFGISKVAGDTNVWYITDVSNESSIRLAKKSGFAHFSYGRRGYLWNIKLLKQVLLCSK
jgi:RimJ/RimL family protein N-acetyltransferase